MTRRLLRNVHGRTELDEAALCRADVPYANRLPWVEHLQALGWISRVSQSLVARTMADVTEQQLKEAVAAVGDSAEKVREYLRKL
ncbi:DUF3606 domain-containing protein [Variovorax sp. J22R115]|uniref:DUF3606 domain-containing protein n=1 Tax=Variovorax sp. J22R115 TaxID=3053509 RepID=UPI002577D2AB|nr:DUF3606 domain-containing protein [Variovorax sp. J22R115]MDM0047616.1 DUF3606 domain-containing protein [Variovorax sp. J22R115]